MDRETPVRMVYLVTGETGEYGDCTEWTVAAFLDKEAATTFRKNLVAMYTRRKPRLLNYVNWKDQQKAEEEMRQFDPQFSCDHGTKYSVAELPLRG